MENSLEMYAVDLKGNVLATKQATRGYRLNSSREFFREVMGAHAIYVRQENGTSWYISNEAYDSWYRDALKSDADLPKPFQMYLMLLGE